MFNFISKRLDVGKVSVYRCKSDIRDLIERLKSLHYDLADLIGRYLMITLIIKTVLDLIYDLLEIGIRHGSLRAGGCKSRHQLLTREILSCAVLLDDLHAEHFGSLGRRIAVLALDADSSAPNGTPLIRGACINYFIVISSALGTLHY